jgi:hypothetical protein
LYQAAEKSEKITRRNLINLIYFTALFRIFKQFFERILAKLKNNFPNVDCAFFAFSCDVIFVRLGRSKKSKI